MALIFEARRDYESSMAIDVGIADSPLRQFVSQQNFTKQAQK